jgi:hypothetical protein
MTIRVVSDLDQCRAIWEETIPPDTVTDLWGVRTCFQKHFDNRPYFIVAEEVDRLCGLLPLSWIDECGCYGFFPGETWLGKTWLEQNKIVCTGNGGLRDLLSSCPSDYYLRYLSPVPDLPAEEKTVDETGYLFLPPECDYDMANYLERFSRKSAKKILRELAAIESLGVAYRYDEIADFDVMVEMSLERFGNHSYFFDPRFRDSFRELARFLQKKGWLRFTTVLIKGEPAATDMGCIYRGVYTLFAGGTNSHYPGVAKLINFHHMEWACRERLEQVDFLCGSFNWKDLFHLTPRPLYLLTNIEKKAE